MQSKTILVCTGKPGNEATRQYLYEDGAGEGVVGGVQGLLVPLVNKVKVREGHHPRSDGEEVVSEGVSGGG